MNPKQFDIIVIGAGSAGLSVSLGMHEFGFKVLLIDKSDKMIGGECLNTGCVPSKALIHVAKTIHEAKQATGFGLKVTGETDFKKVRKYIQNVQNTIKEHENARYLSELGMKVVLGKASFSDENSVRVNGNIYSGKKIVIATGSKPKKISAKGVEQVNLHTHETVFNLKELPKKLLVIGGGPVGVEFTQAFNRLGSSVTLIETGSRILSKEDPEISDILLEKLKLEGVRFYSDAEILEFTSSNSISIESNNEKFILDFDVVVSAIGREQSFDDLELEKAGIQINENGLEIDHYLRTSNPNVYVVGDAAHQLYFSHAAEYQATVLIKNFLNPFKSKINYKHFSWVTFTDPEVATFGLNANSLEAERKAFEKLEFDFSEDDRAVIGSYQYGKLILFVSKVIIPGGNREIYGGSMIAPHAGEIIQELVLACSGGLGTKSIFNKTYAYPVASKVNKSIILAQTRKEFGPFIKKILRKLYG